MPKLSASPMSQPKFFATPAVLGKWFRANHTTKTEQWIGFWKRDSGKKSITWPEAVDEALCVGWIDGVRKSIDDERYMIRFTPRKAASTWSAVNIKRMPVLIEEGRVLPEGLAAWQRRQEARSGIYAYENRKSAKLDAAALEIFKANKAAWKYFAAQPPSYQYTITWWIISAKQQATRERRLVHVIEHSAAGEWIPQMKWESTKKKAD